MGELSYFKSMLNTFVCLFAVHLVFAARAISCPVPNECKEQKLQCTCGIALHITARKIA